MIVARHINGDRKKKNIKGKCKKIGRVSERKTNINGDCKRKMVRRIGRRNNN